VPTRATTSDGLVGSLRAAVSELARSFDSITWHLPNESRPPADGEATLALSPIATEVVFGAVREADPHGRGADPSRPLHLSLALIAGDEVVIWIEDTGVGIDAGRATGGSGQGLVLHGTLLALLGGGLVAERVPRGGTRVVSRVPANA